MAAPSEDTLFQRLIDKFNNARFFTISLVLHVVLVAVFGTMVLFEAIPEPEDFVGGEESGFVSGDEASEAPPEQQQQQQSPTEYSVQVPSSASPQAVMDTITANTASPLEFQMTQVIAPSPTNTTTLAETAVAPVTATVAGTGMTAGDRAGIGGFTGGWGKGGGTGTGSGLRQREFEFVAYLGKYSGGNWNSTVELKGGKIVGGSLPNLLYIISKWSKNKIKTNERNVEALSLSSDEIFKVKPPFIFMTGSNDFKLTDKEVETLRKYVMLGGAIWGDSSVPGRRSRFDIAFRREMKRVIPDKDKDFEALPPDHEIFKNAYYPEIKTVPPGINYYQEPVYALKVFDEIAILYTANDYGNMYQFGLTADGSKIDTARGAETYYVALNKELWEQRGLYVHNIEVPALVDAYKFGINIIVHLLTRWEDKVGMTSRL